MSSGSSLDIIIVSFNARDDLDPLPRVASKRRRPSCPHEIVVVDNASRDGSVGRRPDRGRRAHV